MMFIARIHLGMLINCILILVSNSCDTSETTPGLDVVIYTWSGLTYSDLDLALALSNSFRSILTEWRSAGVRGRSRSGL